MTSGHSVPARICPGDLLAALGDLPPGRAAEVYAALGCRVVAMYAVRGDGGCTCPRGSGCADPGKHPCLADWPRAASTMPAEIRRWWQRWPQANVGLVTGMQFDVCDLDGPEGMEALRAALSQRHPAEHVGPVARTGGGGWHLLYAPTGLGNRVGLLPGLDWRGRGGVIVAPPSRHASGQPYQWVRPLQAVLPAVPDELRRLLAPPLPATRPQRMLPAGRAGAWARGALAAECATVARTRPGGKGRKGRNHALNRAAFRLGQLVYAGLLDREGVTAALLDAAAVCGLGESEATATIRSGLAGAKCKPRPGLPAHTGVGG
jgi:hypothetical protein